jgi:hypothetical protein
MRTANAETLTARIDALAAIARAVGWTIGYHLPGTTRGAQRN